MRTAGVPICRIPLEAACRRRVPSPRISCRRVHRSDTGRSRASHRKALPPALSPHFRRTPPRCSNRTAPPEEFPQEIRPAGSARSSASASCMRHTPRTMGWKILLCSWRGRGGRTSRRKLSPPENNVSRTSRTWNILCSATCTRRKEGHYSECTLCGSSVHSRRRI